MLKSGNHIDNTKNIDTAENNRHKLHQGKVKVQQEYNRNRKHDSKYRIIVGSYRGQEIYHHVADNRYPFKKFTFIIPKIYDVVQQHCCQYGYKNGRKE